MADAVFRLKKKHVAAAQLLAEGFSTTEIAAAMFNVTTPDGGTDKNGDWDSFEGQVFTEFTNKPEHYHDGIGTHVIAPFEIPLWWKRYVSFDHGYSRPFSVGFWAVDEVGRAYRYKEWYGCVPRQANVGLKITPREIAEGIVALEKDERDNNLYIDHIADPAIFDRSRGDSVAEQMRPEKGQPGIVFRPGDNTRLAGKMQLHERLRFREDGRPMLYVTTDCPDWIRTVPNLPYSQTKPEDVDTNAEDHSYDETKYFLMAHPIAVTKKKNAKPKTYDPYRRDED